MPDRVVLGELSPGVWGARISKPGFDVFLSDASNMSFDSRNLNTRILMTGSCATTYNSGDARSYVTNVEVQLPLDINYEPIVFMCFIGTIANAMTLDTMKGQKHTTLWFSGIVNANPKDYAQYAWNPTTKKLTFNARCIRMTTPWATNTLWAFRYIVFSNKAD